MAATFNISTGTPVVFTPPVLSVTFTDTTPAVCGVSAWSWNYNNRVVSTTNSWTHLFFDPQDGVMTLTVNTSTVPVLVSDPVNFSIEPAWPSYPSFRILPSSDFSLVPGVGFASITAQNTSPDLMTGTQYISALTYLSALSSGIPYISGLSIETSFETIATSADTYSWYFNNVNVASTRNWEYQFFDPIQGSIRLDMTSMAFMGSSYRTNSTAFSGNPFFLPIWQTLSGVPAVTNVPGLCSVAAQTLTIREENVFDSACEEVEPIIPEGIRGSTTLNPVVTSYELLTERIKLQMGWPIVQIELCDDQIFDFINQGIEWYSKYAGHTEEYLMFDSSIYQCGYGIKMDEVFNRITDYYCPYTAATNPVSAQYVDCDLNNYRKVVGIFSLDPAGGQGYSSEILFNIDYMFAQQAYFGQLMGGIGYDITTWHLLKSWMDLRKKMFATDVYVTFNPSTQLLKLIPEPRVRTGRGRYIGIIGCRLEKSISEMVRERWVQRYALALSKIALAHIRGKFGGVTLFGGAQVNATDLMTQGLEEKTKLEEELMNGYGEAEPPVFFCE